MPEGGEGGQVGPGEGSGAVLPTPHAHCPPALGQSRSPHPRGLGEGDFRGT